MSDQKKETISLEDIAQQLTGLLGPAFSISVNKQVDVQLEVQQRTGLQFHEAVPFILSDYDYVLTRESEKSVYYVFKPPGIKQLYCRYIRTDNLNQNWSPASLELFKNDWMVIPRSEFEPIKKC